MTTHAWISLLGYLAVLLGCAWPLGLYMAAVLEGRATWLTPLLRPLERACYRLAGTGSRDEMGWRGHAGAVLAFNAAGILAVYALQRLQLWLPLNPQHLGAVSTHSAFNTAISFGTNTNWQGYGGESTMSYLTQMLGLGVQNFVSAATGIAVMAAVIRGITRHSMDTLGNFWTDLVRSTVHILLPL